MGILPSDIKAAEFSARAIITTDAFGSPRAAAELALARRHARIVLAVLWLGFFGGTALWPADATFAVMVLLIGISTVLESVHGALALEQTLQRFRRR